MLRRIGLAAALCAAGCESEGPVQASLLIGPSGGTVALGDTATLTVPSGALSSPAQITLSEAAPAGPPGFTLQSSLFQLDPADLALGMPASLSVPIWGGTDGQDSVALFSASDGGVEGFAATGEPVAAPPGDTAIGALTAPISHFGSAFVASASVQMAQGLVGLAGPAVAGRSVYSVINPDPFDAGIVLQRFDLDGWQSVQVTALAADAFGGPLVARGANLYLGTRTALFEFVGGQGPVLTLTSGAGRVMGVAFNDTGVYWTEARGTDAGTLGRVLSYPDDAGVPLQVGGVFAGELDAIATDDQNAYVADSDGGLHVFSLVTGTVEQMFGVGTVSGGLSVVDGGLYWFDNSGAGQIQQMALPAGSAFPSTLWTAPSGSAVGALATDGQSLTWIAYSPYGPLVCRWSLSAGTNQCLVEPSAAPVQGLALAAGRPVWMTGNLAGAGSGGALGWRLAIWGL
jgi:hypothetical protein